MSKKALLTIFCFLVLVLCISSSYAQEKTLKVGFIANLGNPMGRGLQKSLEAVIPLLNSKGGLAVGKEKYKVELVTYDNKGSMETAKSAVERLVFKDKVKFILGDTTVESWLPITEENKVVAIVETPSPTVLKPEHRYVFQATSLNTLPTVVWGWFAQNYPDKKTVAALYPDALHGHHDAEQLQLLCKAFGQKVVNITFYPMDTTDFSAMATKIKASNPEVFTTAGGGPVQDSLTIKALREVGWKGIFVNYRGFSPGLQREMQRLHYFEDAIFTLNGHEWAEVEPLRFVYKEFIEAYIAKHGKYDYVGAFFIPKWYALAEAIRKAQSVDPEKVANVLASGLRFDSPYGQGMMVSRPDMGNQRTVDVVFATTIGTIQKGKVKVVYQISTEEAFEFLKKSGLFGYK